MAVAGGIDGLADAGELLDLMYGAGALMGDERKQAFRLLGVGHLGMQVEFQTTLREVEHFARVGKTDESAESLAKAELIRQKLNDPNMQNAVTFAQWVGFAVDNNISSKDKAKPLISKENVHELERARAGKGGTDAELVWKWFAIIVVGLGMPRSLWSDRQDKTKVVGPFLGCMMAYAFYGSVFYAPFYWAVLSWKLNGTVPFCEPCLPGPARLVLPKRLTVLLDLHASQISRLPL